MLDQLKQNFRMQNIMELKQEIPKYYQTKELENNFEQLEGMSFKGKLWRRSKWETENIKKGRKYHWG
jgi:hypothetical protein